MSRLALLAGSAHPALARAIAGALEVSPVELRSERFPDGERHVEILETVRGRDVYVVQSTAGDPDGALMEALQLADAARRDDAGRVTAVFPYFAYARQDRRAGGRECVAARLVADLVKAAGVERVVLLDPHSTALEGFFGMPCEIVSAIPLLAEALRPLVTSSTVVVSPDLGGAKLASQIAALLGVSAAHVHKERTGPTRVSARRVAGDVRDRTPLLVDDMISTGATLKAAAAALAGAGAAPPAAAAATHGLFVGDAVGILSESGIGRFVVTDSVPGRNTPLPLTTVGAAPLLAGAIARLSGN
ncbi:MAG: ribose-phosphate pyrophosphokinase [Planctomycetia bacterium]|nr:ribose-phosphate pyrophosphokinase [Planctomycetia bacterium]